MPRSHILALKAFTLLRSHGLNNALAVRTIEEALPAITVFVRDGEPPNKSFKFGVRIASVRGRLTMSPIDAPLLPAAKEVGRLEFDLRGIASLLPPP